MAAVTVYSDENGNMAAVIEWSLKWSQLDSGQKWQNMSSNWQRLYSGPQNGAGFKVAFKMASVKMSHSKWQRCLYSVTSLNGSGYIVLHIIRNRRTVSKYDKAN